jgi:hypothetical protein
MSNKLKIELDYPEARSMASYMPDRYAEDLQKFFAEEEERLFANIHPALLPVARQCYLSKYCHIFLRRAQKPHFICGTCGGRHFSVWYISSSSYINVRDKTQHSCCEECREHLNVFIGNMSSHSVKIKIKSHAR